MAEAGRQPANVANEMFVFARRSPLSGEKDPRQPVGEKNRKDPFDKARMATVVAPIGRLQDLLPQARDFEIHASPIMMCFYRDATWRAMFEALWMQERP